MHVNVIDLQRVVAAAKGSHHVPLTCLPSLHEQGWEVTVVGNDAVHVHVEVEWETRGCTFPVELLHDHISPRPQG